MTKNLFIFFFVLSSLVLRAQERFTYEHRQMGTQIRLVFYTSDKQKADSVSKLVFARIDRLNDILSDYIPDSELNRLGSNFPKSIMVSDDLYLILSVSKQISEKTEGTFDITAGPVIRLWRNARKTEVLPSKVEIKDAKRRVGYSYLELQNKKTVRLAKEHMQLDMGGIGKGFAADEALKILEVSSITSALIDMGGDIRVSNPPPNRKHWLLAFSYFDEEGKEILQKIRLKNQAVATSGDLYQFVEIDGTRYSHIVDPRTGYALQNGIQATVIAPNATYADAYASAFSVMGIEKTRQKLKEIPNLEVFLVERPKNTYGQWSSEGFESFMIKN